MNPPTAADIRAWTPATVDWGDYGYPAGATPDPLEEPAAQAAAQFALITGLSWSTIEQQLATVSPPLTSDDLMPLVRRAASGLAVLAAAQSQPDYLETLADFDLIQSFTAGGYSETRRGAEDAAKAKAIVAWPWLNGLLWQLLTPDRYGYWLAFFSGEEVPAFEVSEVRWGEEGVLGFGHGGWW